MRALVLLAALAACGGHAAVVEKPTAKKAAARDPIKPAAQKAFDRAMSAIRVGGPDAAENAKARLKEALQTDPTIWEAWHDLGVIAWGEGDDDAAVDNFTHALAIVHDRVPTLLARAEAYRRSGHKREARADYENALKHTEEDDPNRRDGAARPRLCCCATTPTSTTRSSYCARPCSSPARTRRSTPSSA